VGSYCASSPNAHFKDYQEQRGGGVLKPKVFMNTAPEKASADKKFAHCDKRLVKEKGLCFKFLEPRHVITTWAVKKVRN
jgi:hypothetical protein